MFGREPAVWIGFLSALVVLVAQQAITSGIVSSTGSVNLLNLVVSATPLIAALIIRNFVSPTNPGG